MINICNIERFATHDGEGIRSVVFFQGCPLKCPWCANPESQEIKTHLMYDKTKCIACGKCETNCPKKAIKFVDGNFTRDKLKCIYCGQCEIHCIPEAISFVGKQIKIDEIIEEVMKDKQYYKESNGGITISGGEAFVQFDGFLKLIKRCKEEELNVCVETCGQFPLRNLIEAYPYIDTYYFDIKHLDDTIYRNIVKGDLQQVNNNLEYLIRRDPSKVVFRVPVIPGFNDDEKVLKAIINLAQQSKVKEVHFLAYHTLGITKYDRMMNDYEWDRKILSEKSLEKYIKIAQLRNVVLKIGG